jgi:hypothetical protein
LWKGNIGKALELALEKKHLSDWLVAISHLGRHIDSYKISTCYPACIIESDVVHR